MFLGTFPYFKNKYFGKIIKPIGRLLLMFKINECKKLMKKCKVCSELKLISDFYKCSATKDGYRNQCKACMRNKEKTRYLLICLECGTEFTAESKKQKFCSVECRTKSQYNKEEVLCDYCGKSIKLPKYRIERNNHHFCSTKCHGKWKSENKKGENHPNYNKEEVLCDCCKKPIKLKKSEINRKNHHFCNRKCYGKWKSENKKSK